MEFAFDEGVTKSSKKVKNKINAFCEDRDQRDIRTVEEVEIDTSTGKRYDYYLVKKHIDEYRGCQVVGHGTLESIGKMWFVTETSRAPVNLSTAPEDVKEMVLKARLTRLEVELSRVESEARGAVLDELEHTKGEIRDIRGALSGDVFD